MFLYIYFYYFYVSPQRKSSLFIFSNQFNGRLQILLLFFGIGTEQARQNQGRGGGADFDRSFTTKEAYYAHHITTLIYFDNRFNIGTY